MVPPRLGMSHQHQSAAGHPQPAADIRLLCPQLLRPEMFSGNGVEGHEEEIGVTEVRVAIQGTSKGWDGGCFMVFQGIPKCRNVNLDHLSFGAEKSRMLRNHSALQDGSGQQLIGAPCYKVGDYI